MSVGHDDTVAGQSLPTAPDPGDDGGIPTLVAGRYQIVRWLGGGGMGRVYEAHDTELGEQVALKVLRAGIADDSIERFRREVRLTRKIQHRNVARMFDIGDHRGEKFLTMELVAGEPLTRTAQLLEWPRLQQLAMQICEGLAAAHAAGVIHRDLKPDNVMLERATDRVVITDFGIARSGSDASVTQLGALVGTPRYMAPEQLAGSEVDARADLFALGVMLFELSTGQRPWGGENAIAIAVAQATQPVRPFHARRLPLAFGSLVMELLALDRDQRPASAAGLAARLAAITHSNESDGVAPRITPPPAGMTLAGLGMGAPTPTRAMSSATRPPSLSGASGTTSVPGATTIAVLHIAHAAADRYLADTLREELADTLSAGALRVRPAMALDPAADPQATGRTLGVDHVVVGSVRRVTAGLRIAVRLIGIADGFQIWAHRVECAEGELLAASDDLARGIAQALSTRAVAPNAERPTDPQVVELYLRARGELRRFWGDHAQTAADLLAQADAITPDSPTVVSLLALARTQAWLKIGDPLLLPLARAEVARALGSGHVDALLASSLLRQNEDDLVGGATELAHALVRGPMAASAHEMAGRLIADLGPTDEARRYFATAMALDPGREGPIQLDLIRIEALYGEWEAADRRNDRLMSDPDPAVFEAGALSKVRLAAWRKNMVGVLESIAGFVGRFGPVATMVAAATRQWIDTQTFDVARWDAVVAAPLPGARPSKMQVTLMQRTTEMALALEQPASAWKSLAKAVDHGLVDLVWFDRMPLFVPYRDEAIYQRLRVPVAERASATLAAFRAGMRTSS